MNSKTPKIQARDLAKSFGSKQVLQDINFTVNKGETYAVIGGSGSGKSVLLKCLIGLLEPTQGQVLIDGQDTTHLPARERMRLMKKFGMLFQNSALFDSMKVWENIAFGHIQQGMRPRQAKDVAVDKLAQVGLSPDVADLSPAELSGGMRKRAALARAICLEPEIIFYDEPTTGLDPITADVINDLILKLQHKLGITSVVITHNMSSAYKIANRIGMLYKGKFIMEGSVEEVRETDNPYVSQFINGRAEGPIQMTV